VLDGGIIQVIDKRDLARADSTVPVETRLVRVNYAKASALVPSVASILTKRARSSPIPPATSLVITEITSRISRVEEFVKGLDIATPRGRSRRRSSSSTAPTWRSCREVRPRLQTQFFNKLVQRPDPRPRRPSTPTATA